MAPNLQSLFPSLQHNVTQTTSCSELHGYSSDPGNNAPIVILVHGYPQTAYIWRHVIPTLQGRYALYIPEIPGYGISAPAADNSRKTIGSALFEALAKTFDISPANPRSTVLAGHDRGARICHYLAVNKDNYPHLQLQLSGVILIDILPTAVQMEIFSNPSVAVGTFHWPFLANVELAVEMISAYGGSRWCRTLLQRWRGTNEQGIKRLEADNAVEVYATAFASEDTIRNTCEDYAAALDDYHAQKRDQDEGRKIDVPTLVIFSERWIGSSADVAGVWRDWVKPGGVYEAVAIGEGYGHYLAEEAGEVLSSALIQFLGGIKLS